jgi:prepilin-type N-terminal cleavage/methylation domain-containing protein
MTNARLKPTAERVTAGAACALPRLRGRRLANESGFTLIEMLIVALLLGFLSAMFAVTLGATVTRSSSVSDQNILQTEVRASLNEMVDDIRSATHGDTENPIIYASNTKITIFSPDRQAPNKMRRVSYWLDGTTLKRQVALSTNSNGPPWDGIEGGDVGTISTVVTSVQSPAIPAQPGAPYSGWAAGQIFKYCGQNPWNMAALPSSDAPDPITWTCTPAALADVRTIVVRVAVHPSPRSSTYTYGAVATLRWNDS